MAKANAGNLLVGFGIDNSQFKKDMRKTQREGDKWVKKLQRDFNKLNLKQAAKSVALFGVAFAFATAKVVQAAAAQQDVFRRLQSMLELQGKSWDKVKPKVDAFTKSMQNTTRFGDTQTADVLQKLLIFTTDLDKAMFGAKLAMDLAASGLFNIDSAARNVGLAMSGNIEILGRYISEFKVSNNVLLKTMTTTEKAAFAMKVLQEKVGGLAEKDLLTFNGRLSQLKNFMGDVVELVGDQFLPDLTELAIRTKEWVTANDALIKVNIEKWVGDLVEKTKELVGFAKDHGDLIGKIFVVGTLSLVVPKLVAMGVALVVIAKTLATIQGLGFGALLHGVIGAGAIATSDKPLGIELRDLQRRSQFSFGGGTARGGRGASRGFGGSTLVLGGGTSNAGAAALSGGGGPFTQGIGGGTGSQLGGKGTIQERFSGIPPSTELTGVPQFRFDESIKKFDELGEKSKSLTKTMSVGWVNLGNTISKTMARAIVDSKNASELIRGMFISMIADIAAKLVVFGIFNAITGGGFSLAAGGVSGFLGFPSGGQQAAGKPTAQSIDSSTMHVNFNGGAPDMDDFQLAQRINNLKRDGAI